MGHESTTIFSDGPHSPQLSRRKDCNQKISTKRFLRHICRSGFHSLFVEVMSVSVSLSVCLSACGQHLLEKLWIFRNNFWKSWFWDNNNNNNNNNNARTMFMVLSS